MNIRRYVAFAVVTVLGLPACGGLDDINQHELAATRNTSGITKTATDTQPGAWDQYNCDRRCNVAYTSCVHVAQSWCEFISPTSQDAGRCFGAREAGCAADLKDCSSQC